MKQSELMYKYNDATRPKFNPNFFKRDEDDIIESLKHIILSCERNSVFTIKVLGFEVIDNYDDVNHILWQYEDSILNKSKDSDKQQVTNSSSSNKKVMNQYDFINLKETDIKLLKVNYFIEIVEKKNGLVNDTLSVYIAVPRVIDKYYYRINGILYSLMFQIVDASTYNNSASKSSTKKQSITFKTVFMPIRVYRYTGMLKDLDGNEIPCIYFLGNMFSKSVLLMKYIFARMGLYKALQFLKIENLFVINSLDNLDTTDKYVFPVRDMFIAVPKYIYDNSQITQSAVYTIHSVLVYMKNEPFVEVFIRKLWIKSLGSEFTVKDIDTIYYKGISILASLEFIYDDQTKLDLKLDPDDKDDIYKVLRWMMYEFNALRQKDNLDVSTKKVRNSDVIGALYASRLASGIYRISDKGDKADLQTIRKAIQIPPMYLINAITKCQLVNYKDSVNDLDSLNALKYTYKGVSGIGEKSNAISMAYRSIHPSHLGRVDIDSSSNSDPGVSGTLCPLGNFHDSHFIDFKEPSEWRDKVLKLSEQYRSMNNKKELCRLISDNELSPNNDNSNGIINECMSLHRDLSAYSLFVNDRLNQPLVIDIFGDGMMLYEEE